MDKINVIHHMNEFRNILSYATNIGFFFGAGTSCAFGLPTIWKLTEQTKTSLSTPEQNLYNNVESSVKDLSGKSEVTIENILNHLREIRELTNGREDYDFRQYVDSSMITSIGYDPNTCTLEVEFKSDGAIWQYPDFLEYLWYEFEASDSKGKFFHQNIRGKFNEFRVG